MSRLLSTIPGPELVFWFFAIVGTVFFALRMLAAILGGFGAESSDADVSTAEGGTTGDVHSAQLEGAETSFKLVSVTSLTGFFMMFGWGGLVAARQFGLGPLASFLIAFLAGGLTMVATAQLFKSMLQLQSPGDRLDLNAMVGGTATVYARIPAGGRGQIKITHDNLTRTIDAVSASGADIESFSNVKVVSVFDSRTLSVTPL